MLRIFSDQPLDESVYDQVMSIVQHSQCPHESLSSTFPEQYQRMVDFGDEVHVYFSQSSVPHYEMCIKF